tara:strand:+ start:1752 stop:2867 length:1116 start_codon:yes stop_codon:yes gene_type:complete
MSTLKVDAIRHNSATSDAITTASDGTCTAKLTSVGGGQLSHRNIIVNGAMNVSQRGDFFGNVGQQQYTIDRFVTLHSYGNVINVTQTSTSPDGFSKAYKVDCQVADTSIGAAEFMFVRYKIEAQDLQQLAYGTSGAKSITLSFYVRSTVTGTYAICLQQKDNSSKQVNGTYTINSANTWERKIFTFAGDTSGVINNDNGHGLDILWTLVAGSDRTSGSARPTWTAHANADESFGHTANVLSSTSNDWLITGVQLEVGDTATSFEHRSHAEELELCKRYYQQVYFYWNTGSTNSNYLYYVGGQFHPVMRAAPSLVAAYDNNNQNSFETRDGGTWRTGLPSLIEAQPEGIVLRSNNNVIFNAIKGIAHFDAEL